MAKVMVSLPDELLTLLDAEVRRRRTTRSGLLAAAVRKELESPGAEARREAVARIAARAARLGWPSAEDVRALKAERELRDLGR